MNEQKNSPSRNNSFSINGNGNSTGSRPCRIALYSPGMVGIGHMRRNLLIAQTLARSHLQPIILMIAEAREANVLAMPPRGDCLTLPALRKEYDGACRPRYMDVSLRELIALRAKTIAAALEAFMPDVLIVDHLPRGALRELDRSLAELRVDGCTRCVLGLRDVLEAPERVRRDWRALANEDAIRDYYDAVWVYGDPAVYDPVREYDFSPEIAAKVRYTGYLDCRVRNAFGDTSNAESLATLLQLPERLMLCMVGGGQDGANLAEAFAQAQLPPDAIGVILMGPFMPAEAQQRVQRQAAGNSRLRVLGYVTDPDLLLTRAERVIAMGGYNTICEMLSFQKHVLIVPRSKPRHEQQIRAERLHALGLIDVLQPEEANPEALSDWMGCDLGPPPRVRERINLNGTARLPHLLEEVLAAPAFPEWGRSEKGEIEHAAI